MANGDERDSLHGSVGAILLGAGGSRRMGGIDKTFEPVGGRPLISYSLDVLQQCSQIDEVVLVLGVPQPGTGRGAGEGRPLEQGRPRLPGRPTSPGLGAAGAGVPVTLEVGPGPRWRPPLLGGRRGPQGPAGREGDRSGRLRRPGKGYRENRGLRQRRQGLPLPGTPSGALRRHRSSAESSSSRPTQRFRTT